MTTWRHILAVAERRAAGCAALSGAALALSFAAGGALLWAASAVAMEWPVRWPLVGGGVVAVTVVGAVVGYLRRPSALAVAAALDHHAGDHNAIASALQFSAKAAPTPLERQAIADADAAAQSVNPAGAFPLRLRRPAILAALAVVMLAGAALIPARWTARVVQFAGLNPGPPKVEVQKALADTTAAEQLIKAVQQPSPTASPAAADSAASRSDPLAELREQLQHGEVTPKEATQQAATAIERAADKLDERAADAQQASDLLRDRLAQGMQSRESKDSGASESELTKALREGNLDKAAAEAERLAGENGADKLPPAERAKLAEELRKLADDLKRPPTPPSADKPQTPVRPDAATKPDAADKPASPPKPPSADQPARDLADKLDRAAEELKSPPASPSKPPDQKPQPSKPPTDTPSKPEAPSQPPPTGERAQGQAQPDKPQDGNGEPAKPEGGKNEPKPQGDKPASEQPSPSPKDQPGKSDQPSPQPSDTPKPGEKPQPADKPQPDGKNGPAGQQGEHPAPGEKQDSSQPPAKGEQPKPGTGTQPKSDPNAPPRDGQQPADEKKPQPGEQSQGGEGDKPKADFKPKQDSGQPSPDDKPNPQGEPKPDASKPSPDGHQPSGTPPKGSSLEQLKEQLKKLADQPRNAKQDKQDAQKLREQAQKMWDNASPEQRKVMEQLARELAKERGKGSDQKQQRAEKDKKPGTGATGTKPDENNNMPPSGGGASGDPLANAGRDPGNGLPGDKPQARNPSGSHATTQDVDARSKGAAEAPSRIIAEWLTNKPAPRTGDAPTAAPADVTQAVRQAQQNAEQAVQQRTVPSRLSPLVRRYFDRLPSALGTQPATPPASSTPPAPAVSPPTPATPKP